jgi:hypothetical protein
MARYISYARICVYMNVANALPESIIVSYQDEEWTQPLDYEHIPFRCRNVTSMAISLGISPLMFPLKGIQERKKQT